MKLETFKKVFELYQKNEEFLNNTKDLLKLEMYEVTPVECFWETMDILWREIYTEEGIDWINWYMFEKSEGLCAYQDGEIFLETLEELWEYVENNYKIQY